MTVDQLNSSIAREMFEIQQTINNLGVESRRGRIMSLFRFLPVYFTEDARYFNCGSFSHQPVKSIKDENNITYAVIGISDIPFDEFFNKFASEELSIKDGFVNVFYNEERTNIYIKMSDYYPIYLKRNDYYGYLGSIEELVQLITYFDLDLNEIDFVTYRDFGDSDSDVIVAYKTRYGWCGGSHRAFDHFKIGDEIDLKEYTLLLRHGYIKGPKYEEETKLINKIKSYADKNQIVKIENEEIAKNLAIRLAQATS